MRLDSETLEEAQAEVEALRAIVAILTSLTKQRLSSKPPCYQRDSTGDTDVEATPMDHGAICA
jgi:hypothetical protein